MSTSDIVDVRGHSSWYPPEILYEAFVWPTGETTVVLGEVAESLTPRHFAEDRVPVVTPTSVDRVTGAIRKLSTKHLGRAYRVGPTDKDLAVGDVLIPRHSGTPAVLINQSMSGMLFSNRFAAYRFANSRQSQAAWAILSSKSGQQARATLPGGHGPQALKALSGMEIPSWILDADNRILGVKPVLSRLEKVEPEESSTWWAITDLRQTEWRFALATPRPDQLEDGTPLSRISTIRSGRRVPKEVCEEFESDGFLPVVSGSVLSGVKDPSWAPNDGDFVVAEPGEILVAEVGVRNSARVCETPSIVDQGVLVIKPHDSKVVTALAGHLNGYAAAVHRKMLLGGTVIRRISRNDLGRIPVPDNLPDEASPEHPLVPLADELEAQLW